MKKDQRNQLNHNEKTDRDQEQAEQTARILETNQAGQRSHDDLHVLELGNLIRQTHSQILPEPNPELRKRLLDEIEDNENRRGETPVSGPEKVVLEKSNGRLHSSYRFLALAVALMVAMGITIYFMSPTATRLAMKNNNTMDFGLESKTSELSGHFIESGASTTQPMPGEDFIEHEVEKSEANKINNDPNQTVFLDLGRAAAPTPKDAELTLGDWDLTNYERPSGKDALTRGAHGPVGPRGPVGPSRPEVTFEASEGIVGSGPTNRGRGGVAYFGEERFRSSGTSVDSAGMFIPGEAPANITSFSTRLDTPQLAPIAPGDDSQTDDGYGVAGRFAMDLEQRVEFDFSNVEKWEERGGRRAKHLGFGRNLESKTNAEQYIPIHENKFITTNGGAAISTFSIDVDTAAYSNMRRFINSGQLPPRDSIRIEELVNYFKYDYPQPTGDDPFSVNMEFASCPWNTSHKLLRVGLKGKDVHVAERPPTNVVFLIDVSGSMNSNDKLPLLKRGFQMMVNELTENDRVSIVTYAGNAGVVLEPVSGDQHDKINAAIENLSPGGSTHGSAGIELAYKLAQQEFINEGANKVVLATDGDLNVGITEDAALVNLIKQKASEGVFLTVLGFGTGNLKDGKMEQLADNGNGLYAYIDSLREARKVLVEQLSGSLVTIAKDVKIQIEFNPAEVKQYRLIGYENRMLATKDFDDDKKDAGEIGAGHTVTAIYELVTTDPANTLNVAPTTELKYQSVQAADPKQETDSAADLSPAAETGELLTLALRYKQPESNTSKRIEFTLNNEEKSFAGASADFRFAASVASFGMLLRGSQYAGDATPNTVQDIATAALGNDESGIRAEFVDLVRKVVTQN